MLIDEIQRTPAACAAVRPRDPHRGRTADPAAAAHVASPQSAPRTRSRTRPGAIKGILVTTSRFDAESYRIARDKPLNLIVGEQLREWLRQYLGINARQRLLTRQAERSGQTGPIAHIRDGHYRAPRSLASTTAAQAQQS